MHKAVRLLKKIPKGKVVTYKEMARVCRTSPRAIGSLMSANADPVNYPCYKVVSVTGALCGYSGKGGLKTKAKLLKNDDITIKNSKVDKKHFYCFPARSS